MPDPKKLIITAYTDASEKPQMSSSPDDIYVAQVNPETYAIRQVINYHQAHTIGAPQVPKYLSTSPANFQFEFLFDGTGIIPKPDNLGALGDIPLVGAVAGAISSLVSPQKPYDVMTEIDKFRNVVLGYRGDLHMPRLINLLWGKLIFDGKLTSLNLNFKLFKPDGTCLRAIATANFVGFITEKNWVKKHKPSSPDLTHTRQVMEGDTLPLMSYRIYGDASYYLEVARVNNIVNFRNLKPGDRIYFPPINKNAQ
jgi:hypothetical protein